MHNTQDLLYALEHGKSLRDMIEKYHPELLPLYIKLVSYLRKPAVRSYIEEIWTEENIDKLAREVQKKLHEKGYKVDILDRIREILEEVGYEIWVKRSA